MEGYYTWYLKQMAKMVDQMAKTVDGPGESISPQDIEARSEGLIRLDVNFRTKSGLLNVMNEWWKDVFSERHRKMIIEVIFMWVVK